MHTFMGVMLGWAGQALHQALADPLALRRPFLGNLPGAKGQGRKGIWTTMLGKRSVGGPGHRTLDLWPLNMEMGHGAWGEAMDTVQLTMWSLTHGEFRWCTA